MRRLDVAVVGAGPAGLFATLELVKATQRRVKVGLFDKGARVEERFCPIRVRSVNKRSSSEPICKYCKVCSVIYGFGGAGAFSGGVFNLRPDVGGDLDKLLGSWVEAERLIEYIDNILVEFGSPPESLYKPDDKRVRAVERLAAKAGAKFVPTPQRVLGSENVVKLVSSITKFLEENGVSVYNYTEVYDIVKDREGFVLSTNKGEFYASKVLLAPGRGGAHWLKNIAEKLGLEVEPSFLDIGVRVEVPYYVTESIVKVNYDPKFIIYTKSYDDMVRTFCTNPNGFVIKEFYDDGTIGVNGETYSSVKSKNTNFALLVTLKLTVPYTDVLELGKSIAKIATKVGIGKPIIQRLGDLEKGRRSTWERIERSIATPTLRDVTPGDVSLVLPHRVVENIVEAIARLDTIYPGLASPQTLLYAPEIKYYSLKIKVDRNLETNVRGLYVAGDGAGLSRGLNIAAATGVLAARSIIESL